MIVAIVVTELHLPSARSLKDKRRVVASLVERLHQRHRVSVAQVGQLEAHQRAELGIAVVGIDADTVHHVLAEVRRMVEDDTIGEAWVTRWDESLLEEGT
jgi:uncharacterized protein YlxP (DUF503 family)